MAVKEKRESTINPVIFKFGVALAISLGGIVYSFFRSKTINKPSKPKPSLPPPDKRNQVSSRGESVKLRDDDPALQDKVSSQNSKSGFLLSEFDQLVKECNMSVRTDDVESPREYECAEHKMEITSLRKKVEDLEERERILETRLLEYYGLKEQETDIKELQNRLRLHNMEAKLYNLKIESLQSDKRKLESQVAEYAKVVAELEDAKAKIKLLRKKLRTEAEQNREQLLKLQERVMNLQDNEKKAVENDVDMKLHKKKELEEELEEMKKYNHNLKLENSELASKLECVQMLATSAFDNEEVQALKEEGQLLRQQNEDLRKEIEQLQADRCIDVEELVYLRWINACLRYEMRNYQPGPGETIARDLSKTLSPKSEKKAKQLILEYANKEGSILDKGINISDFDADHWSISQGSYLTDEPDDLHIDNLSANRPNHSSKSKVFAKLMKLLRGKDSHHYVQTPTSPLEIDVSVDDIVSRYSSNSHSCISLGTDAGADGLVKKTRTLSEDLSRQSFDLQRSSYSRGLKSTNGENSNCSRRTSDDVSLSIFRKIDAITGYDDAQNAGKAELAKYAEALKNSHVKSSFHRRSASFSSV